MGVSKNSGTILIGFSIINHPFWGTTILGNTHIAMCRFQKPRSGASAMLPMPFGAFRGMTGNDQMQQIDMASTSVGLHVHLCSFVHVWELYGAGLLLKLSGMNMQR